MADTDPDVNCGRCRERLARSRRVRLSGDRRAQHDRSANPEEIFSTLVAYQKAAALKGAIELDLFTAIGEGVTTAPALANRLAASSRGVRSLGDYLVIAGFLTKAGDDYGLTATSAKFLDRRSPTYMGTVASFLGSRGLAIGFDDIAGAVRKGGTLLPEAGTMAPDNPVWVEFARGMAPIARLQAAQIADLVRVRGTVPERVLDIAAGHGHYGIALGRLGDDVGVVGQDWENVLAVARENAEAAGLGERYSCLAGDCRTIDLGGPYDAVLVTNFLHHFSIRECEEFLRRVHEVLAPGGTVIVLESVPDESRLTPARPASFSLVMLATTASGDAYTSRELESMLANSGFTATEQVLLQGSMQTVFLSRRKDS